MIVGLSLLVAIVGVLAYALSSNTKVATLGLIAYGVGLGVFLLQAQQAVNLLGQ